MTMAGGPEMRVVQAGRRMTMAIAAAASRSNESVALVHASRRTTMAIAWCNLSSKRKAV